MFETVIIIVISIFVIGVLVWVWEDVKGKYFQPRIYLVPNKKEFILSQGNYKIVFDTLTHIPARDPYLSTDELYISKYSSISTQHTDYLALDKNGKLVAIVPYTQNHNSSLPLYTPGSDKPEWLRIIDFEKKQHNILKSSH